ncbi:MAG: hypothetical protein JXA42_17050 [Anaerolineales bacterium]|nr:hypothetical protein [Anaerolineales bacterium]
MNRPLNVVIVMARCSETRQAYGIRIEKRNQDLWIACQSYPVRDETANKDWYLDQQVPGTFVFDDSFSGCPYCQAVSIFQCGRCRKVSCWDGKRRIVSCAWCGNKGELMGHIESLYAGEER